jgi:hypothetical protein
MNDLHVAVSAAGRCFQRLVLVVFETPLRFFSAFITDAFAHHSLYFFLLSYLTILQLYVSVTDKFFGVGRLQI